ncbi:basic leucine zipper transcriptional factor ATF-like 3 [Nyctibius grandis]
MWFDDLLVHLPLTAALPLEQHESFVWDPAVPADGHPCLRGGISPEAAGPRRSSADRGVRAVPGLPVPQARRDCRQAPCDGHAGGGAGRPGGAPATARRLRPPAGGFQVPGRPRVVRPPPRPAPPCPPLPPPAGRGTPAAPRGGSAAGGMSCAVPAAAGGSRSAAAEGSQQSHEEDDRKVRRREKNRVAAQRSRKKQTQKADKLHEEYESLEQENTSLKREIGKLTDEMKHLSEVLKDHEKICPLLHCTMNFVTVPRPDALASCLPR